jgi:hypothetical protein
MDQTLKGLLAKGLSWSCPLLRCAVSIFAKSARIASLSLIHLKFEYFGWRIAAVRDGHEQTM